MKIIDGREIAERIRDEIKKEINEMNFEITLVIIFIGGDEASKIYIKNKIKKAFEVGIKTELFELNDNVEMPEVLKLIDDLNNRRDVTGFFIQSPIPSHLDMKNLVSKIKEDKDVDGMSPLNLGKLYHGQSALIAATASAVMELLHSVPDVSLESKDVVILNHSPIIGKPLAALLLNENATVQICHIKTKNLSVKTKAADIIILGTGQRNLLKSDDIKESVIIIDCGSPEAEADKSVYEKVGYISLVPGGVGPLTIACLLRNCLKAYLTQARN